MAPQYLDALETQVELIKKYKSQRVMDASLIESVDAVLPEAVSRSEIETGIKRGLVEGLEEAETFYLRTKALREIRRMIESTCDLDADEVVGNWISSYDEISRNLFLYLEEDEMDIDYDGGIDTSFRFKALLRVNYPDNRANTSLIYLFDRNEQGRLYARKVVVVPLSTTETATLLVGFIGAFCYFTQQKIASAFHQPIYRSLERRAKRVTISNPDIVVVTLRKTVRKDAREGGIPNPVFWTHQWEVEGHTHHYWYGSGDDKHLEPKWVDTYPKGPKNAPFIKKDRIKDVRR